MNIENTEFVFNVRSRDVTHSRHFCFASQRRTS